MKKIFCFILFLSCGLSAFATTQKISLGMDYDFYDEFCQIYERKVNTKFHSLGVDLTYRYFDENAPINENNKNLFGLWAALNFNFPIKADVFYDESEMSYFTVNGSENIFLMDTYLGGTYEIDFTKNSCMDLSLASKLSFSCVDRKGHTSPKNIINFTVGLGSEIAFSYFFDSWSIENFNFGLILGTKVNYDFYSSAQSFNTEKYVKYGVFSAVPFLSIIMKF